MCLPKYFIFYIHIYETVQKTFHSKVKGLMNFTYFESLFILYGCPRYLLSLSTYKIFPLYNFNFFIKFLYRIHPVTAAASSAIGNVIQTP